MSGTDHNAQIEAIASRRDTSAFAEVFGYFAPRVKAYGMRSGLDPQRAEELAQEVMILVWRKSVTFKARRASASTWIFTLARNKRVDMLRHEKRHQVNSDHSALPDFEGYTVDDAFMARENSLDVRRSMQELPNEQVEVLRKAYFEDKCHAVISRELGLPLGTVKSRIRLALGRLRVLIGEAQS